jgi:hypothetical protein
MSGALYYAMAIPDSCHLGKRVYKKLFQENAKLGPTDKRVLRDDVDTIVWQYIFKSTTIPIQPYEDVEREYHEVALIQVNLKHSVRVMRLAEIVHRAIPYPLIVVFQSEYGCLISLAHKRFSQAEKGIIVADDFQATGWLDLSAPDESQHQFLTSLDVAGWPHTHFFAFYTASMDRVVALNCSRLSGSFSLNGSAQATNRRERLAKCHAIEGKITELRVAIRKEQQFNRQVEFNMNIKELEARLTQIVATL